MIHMMKKKRKKEVVQKKVNMKSDFPMKRERNKRN